MADRDQQQVHIALIGSGGMLAAAVKAAAPDFASVTGLDLPEFDLTQKEASLRQLTELQPDVIINCAAFTQVDRCEAEEDVALQVNGVAVGTLADAAKKLDATLVHISTDYVFAGDGQQPYVETDNPAPLSAYGRTKLAGEQALLASGLNHYYLIRTSWLYGPGGHNFVETILRLAGERTELRIVHDQIGSPTLTCDLAAAIFQLLALTPSPRAKPDYGIYHFSDSGTCSWYGFACEIVEQARRQRLPLKVEKVLPITTADYPLPAPRPAYSVFSKEKFRQATGAVVPSWQESLAKYLAMREK